MKRGQVPVKTEWIRLEEVGDYVEGELRAYEENALRMSDHPVDVIVLSRVERPDDLRRMIASPRMKPSIEIARRLGWPGRRIYVRYEFIGHLEVTPGGLRKAVAPEAGDAVDSAAPDPAKVRALRMRDIDCQVALLLAYDLKVKTMEELKQVRADDVRVLVQETGLIYRIDARGSNHLPPKETKPAAAKEPARSPSEETKP